MTAVDDAQDLTSQGSVVAGMTGLSRISGFVRDVVFSHFFGATGLADAFFVAFKIPNFFRRLFAEGAFAQAFVPVLAQYRTGSDEAALKYFVRAVSGNLALVLTAVTVVGVIGAPALVAVFAPGFWNDPARLAITTEMVRITFPYLAFISLTALAGSILNGFHRFAIPAFTPVLLNLTLILAALVAAPLFSEPVIALAWGVFVAGVVQLAFQLPAVKRLDLLHRPSVDWRDSGVRRVLYLLGPAVFAASVHQVNALIGTALASMLATGSIAWLYYADRLLELPVGLVAIALGTVLLPSLSRLHSSAEAAAERAEQTAGDLPVDDRFATTLEWGLRVGTLLGIPAAAALYALATPLVSTIFFHGAMTALDVAMAAAALKAFAIGLIPLVIVKVAAPGYFARQDTKTPFRIAVVAVVVNVVLSVGLFTWMGHVGLALATSSAAVVNAYLLVRGLSRRGDLRWTRRLGKTLLAATTAALVMVLGVVMLVPVDSIWLSVPVWDRVQSLAAAVAAGGVLYLAALWLFGLRPADLTHRV